MEKKRLKGVHKEGIFEWLVPHLSKPDASKDALYEEPSLLGKDSSSDVQYAIECGLIEPIFHSVAEYNGDQFEELIKLLQETAKRIVSAFPWMFLAYLGVCYQNVRLVERCLLIINEEKEAGKIQEFEVGMSYQVWRFLVSTGGHLDEKWKSEFLELSWAKHDWTFVHLASAYGDKECLEFLLKQDCNQNMEVLRAATEVEGFTPLHLAAYYGHADIVKKLLKHADMLDPIEAACFSGAAPDGGESAQELESVSQYIPRDRIFKRSPLHLAVSSAITDNSMEVLEILIARWRSVGVDLPDRFGITSLHLAAARRDGWSWIILTKLVAESKKLDERKVCKNFALQKAALLGLIRDHRRYIDESASSRPLFIPRPHNFIDFQFFWFNVGFTVLHVIAIYGYTDDCFNAILGHDFLPADASLWAAPDCQGLNAVDYAASFNRFTNFFKGAREKRETDKRAAAVAETHEALKSALTRSKVNSQTVLGSNAMREVRKLHFVYRLGCALLSGEYDTAVLLSSSAKFQPAGLSISSSDPPDYTWQWTVDDEVWDHLEWALDRALQGPDVLSQLQGGPRLHPSQAEQIVLHLAVHRNLLRGKSTKQRCLQWAIGKRMARLAEELVKDTECELVSVVPGSTHEQSPLAQASESEVATEMPGLLAAMELREDVKRRWFEDRQVYVDYANTLLVGAVLIAGLALLLVGAVLIAGLAFAGWLQPPQGYLDRGVIDMKQRSMRVFVYSSSLAFFLGTGTMVTGATGAMPFAIGAGELIRARHRVHRAIVIASILLVASIISLAISFAAALIAILPFEFQRSVTFATFLVVNGMLLCSMLVSFLRRLHGLSRLPHLNAVKREQLVYKAKAT